MENIRIRLLQSAKFTDSKDMSVTQRSIRLGASQDTQTAPEWIQNDPLFGLLEDDGKIEIVTSSAAKRITAARFAGSGLAGGEVTTDAHVDDQVKREDALLQSVQLSNEKAEADLNRKIEPDEPNEADFARNRQRMADQAEKANVPQPVGDRINGSPREVVEMVEKRKAEQAAADAEKAKADAVKAADASKDAQKASTDAAKNGK